MQNQSGIIDAFSSFKNTAQEHFVAQITPELMFEDQIVQDVLQNLLSEMKVSSDVIDIAIGNATNAPRYETLSPEQVDKIEREEYNYQHASGHFSNEQIIELLNKRATEQLKQEQQQLTSQYTTAVRSKFTLCFALFAINTQKKQASQSTDFFQQLNDYCLSQENVTKRVQLGLDFASSFAINILDQLHDSNSDGQNFANHLKNLYEHLKKYETGSLFGYDKFSFIIDSNLNKFSSYIHQKLLQRQEDQIQELGRKVLLQLGRVRLNPTDILAVLTSFASEECGSGHTSEKRGCEGLSKDVFEIVGELQKLIEKEQTTEKQQQKVSLKFKETYSLDLGRLFYYKAGEFKLDVTSNDQLASDGKSLFHLKRGKGLFKLSVGQTKTTGTVKYKNTSKQVVEMEPCAMFYFKNKLFVRDYCDQTTAFKVFDCQTLELDEEMTEQYKKHFQNLQKEIEKSTNDETHRSLLWHKDNKSGRSLEIAPLFSCEKYVYAISFQKQENKPPMLVVEQYDPEKMFEFVRAQTLFQNDDCDPFVYDNNNINIIKASSFMTNGEIVVMNISNTKSYFFDFKSGKCLDSLNSKNLLMTYNRQTNNFYAIRSSNQLYKIQFENFGVQEIQETSKSEETFDQLEDQYFRECWNDAGMSELLNDQTKSESLMEQIVFGNAKGLQTVQNISNFTYTGKQTLAQIALIMRFLDQQRKVAAPKLPQNEFIKVFKQPYICYLTGSTFDLLIRAAKKYQQKPFILLYILRLLQFNFSALMKCQGSLPKLMRDYQEAYKLFFDLYNSYLSKKVYEQPKSALDEEIKQVCTEIMASSINILYKSDTEIIEKFHSEIKENAAGINCSVFYDYFSQPVNCDKLLQQDVKQSRDIFQITCQVQKEWAIRKMRDDKEQKIENNQTASFMKKYAQRALMTYVDLLKVQQGRPPASQICKLPQHIQDKYAQEDEKIAHMEAEVVSIYKCLTTGLDEILKTIQISSFDKEDNKKRDFQVHQLMHLLLYKSPFAQLQLCLYSTVFTAIDLSVETLKIVRDHTFTLMKTIADLLSQLQQLYPKTTQIQAKGQAWHWLANFQRTLAYLISIKAYHFTKATLDDDKQDQPGIEQQLIKTDILSGGMEESFEKEFSQKTRDFVSCNEPLWNPDSQPQVKECTSYNILIDLITNFDKPECQTAKALAYLQKQYSKDDPINSKVGTANNVGLRLGVLAFSVSLKLYDQTHLLQSLEDNADSIDDMEIDELQAMNQLFQFCNTKMRKWTHELKMSLSERINAQVEQKHRQQKQQRVEEAEKEESKKELEVQQINTQTAALEETKTDEPEQKTKDKYSLTDDEIQLMRQEQEQVFEEELQKMFNQISEKAKYLIKLKAPHDQQIHTQKSNSQSNPNSELLQVWKNHQRSSSRSASHQRKTKMQAFAGDIIQILQQTNFDIAKLVQQIETATIKGHKRVLGLSLFAQVLQISKECRAAYVDSLAWFTSALRYEKTNDVVHYLDDLKGCGIRLEKPMQLSFFQILQTVVYQLSLESNSEQEIILFLHSLRWRFSGRDHNALAELNLFETLHQSPQLKKHWGKQIQTDFSKNKDPGLKFNVNYKDEQIVQDLKERFERFDSNKTGKLNFQQCKDFYKDLMDKYHPFKEFFDNEMFERSFEKTWKSVQVNDKACYQDILKDLPYVVQRSTIGAKILQLLDQIFALTISRLIIPDNKAQIQVQPKLQIARAHSVISQNASQSLLQNLFKVIFSEISRYCACLEKKPGVDWTTYAQNRQKMEDQVVLQHDEYTLLDEAQNQPEQAQDEEKVPEDESEEQKKVRLAQQEAKQQELKYQQEMSIIPRLYSESFLQRLLSILELFTSVSANNNEMIAFARSIANPEAISTLLQLLFAASPKLKFIVIRILHSLILMKLPFELFETAVSLAQKDHIIGQLFQKCQPQLRFKQFKFLALLHQYALSIRQKVWIKSSFESDGMYEISCQLLRLLRTVYECNTQHPWRKEIQSLLDQLFIDLKNTKPREAECLLALLPGADFKGIAAFGEATLSKSDKVSVLGFTLDEWKRRSSNSQHRIEPVMRIEEQSVLICQHSQSLKEAIKLCLPQKLNLNDQCSDRSFQFTVQTLKQVLQNTNLNQTEDDVQLLNTKCMLLKLFGQQLEHYPLGFLKTLKESGYYESLLKYVCKESSVEIKDQIVPVQWLEQVCFNIRKLVCENQLSLLKTQETQMKLVDDKIYASVLNQGNEKDKQYTRVRLQMAFNHKAFVQRKDVKLVSDVTSSAQNEDVKLEQQVAIVEPSELTEGNGLAVLQSSIGLITCDVDLHSLVQKAREAKGTPQQIDEFEKKTIFVVSRAEFDLLHQVCTGQGQKQNQKQVEEQKSFDDEFVDSLVQFGGYSRLLAVRTKQVDTVEKKSKLLFETLLKINDGSLQLKEDDQNVVVSSSDIHSDVLPECQEKNSQILARYLNENNQDRRECGDQERENNYEGRFLKETKVDQSKDLSTLYEEKLKRLFNMQCRHIFWSLIQKDKIESLFDFLLSTEQELKSFVQFMKVVGNESYITNNDQAIKNFKEFIKQVVEVACQNPKFRPLLKIIYQDVVQSYRRKLSSLLQNATVIQSHFMTESEASQLMNPFVLNQVVKQTLKQKGGFDIMVELGLPDIVSILFVINTAFYGNFKLKDKYWLLLIRILHQCKTLPTCQITPIINLPVIKSLFMNLEDQAREDCQEVTYVQSKFQPRHKDVQNKEAFKSAFSLKEKIQNNFLRFNQKRSFELLQVELIYKIAQLACKCEESFFYRNNLTAFAQMRGQLLEQAPDSQLSKHLFFLSQLKEEQQIVTQAQTIKGQKQVELLNTDAEKTMIRIKQSTKLKSFQKIELSGDPEGHKQIASFTQKEIELGFGFAAFHTQKAYLNITQSAQNFTVDLGAEQLSLQPSTFRTIQGPVLARKDNWLLTQKGIFRFYEDDKVHRRNVFAVQDHLRFKQVNFGKDCTIALLPNGTVIGFGYSKHRHFIDKTGRQESQKDTEVIPLVIKEVAKTPEEKVAQREILEIHTQNHTTVCLTREGVVYACGDRFASQQLQIDKSKLPFGFYAIPVDPSDAPIRPKEEPKVEAKAEAEEKKEQKEEESKSEVESKPDEKKESAEEGKVAEPEEEKKENAEEVKVLEPEEDNENEENEDESHQLNEQQIAQLEELYAQQDPSDDGLPPELVIQIFEKLGYMPNEEELEVIFAGDEDSITLNLEELKEIIASKKDKFFPEKPQNQEEQKEESLPIPKAEQVWISQVRSTRQLVILALYKHATKEGVWQFRTCGNSSMGLLGQGKNSKESRKLKCVDFGFELTQKPEQVCVGFNHFMVRYDSKVYAWGNYNTDSEERLIWAPEEVKFFEDYKLKKLICGKSYTSALCQDKENAEKEMLICGKFAPLSKTDEYKSFKDFQVGDQIHQSIFMQGQILYLQVTPNGAVESDNIKESVLEIETCQDYGFKPNQKLYESQKETYDKFVDLFKLPDQTSQEKKQEMWQIFYNFILARLKDQQFEDINWKEIQIDELELPIQLSDEQKRHWFMLIVLYCRHLWGHLTYVGANIPKRENLEIIGNFFKNKQNLPSVLKSKLLMKIVSELKTNSTNQSEKTAVKINRLKAREMKLEGKKDSRFQWSVFSIVSETMQKEKYRGMFQNRCNAADKQSGWHVNFQGESALDDGGLFRESLTELCLELQSDVLDLFKPVSNATNAKAERNKDQWLINPKANSKMHLKKFKFIGALFGMSIRSGMVCNLNLARLFWKHLTSDDIAANDLEVIDDAQFEQFKEWRNAKQTMPEEHFKAGYDLKFTLENAPGDEVELCPNGKEIEVTYSNLEEYINAIIQHRLNESKQQYRAILEGIDVTFSSSYLKMISWRDLELKVVGEHTIDIDQLKKMADYYYCSEKHDTIKKFWKILNSFNQEQRRQYLRFVWGRERLPHKDEECVDTHQIELNESKPKNSLPFGKTCMFRVILPPYDKEDVFKQKLLYAIYNTLSTDGEGEFRQTEPEDVANHSQRSDGEDSDEAELREERERIRRLADEERDEDEGYDEMSDNQY